MHVREEFYYVYEKESYIKSKLCVNKSNMLKAIEAVYDSCSWLENSIFENVSKELYVELSDAPLVDTMALIGIDEKDNQILLFINITHLVFYYEKKDYQNIFNLDKMNCYEFAAFIFLHEIGHLVHVSMQNPGIHSIQNKLRNHLKKIQKTYVNYEKWIKKSKYGKFEANNQGEEHVMVHKKYRKLPYEKQADNFAKRYLSNVKHLNKRKQ